MSALMEESREAFEKWFTSRAYFKKAKMNMRCTNGTYADLRVNDRWLAWKAACWWMKETYITQTGY